MIRKHFRIFISCILISIMMCAPLDVFGASAYFSMDNTNGLDYIITYSVSGEVATSGNLTYMNFGTYSTVNAPSGGFYFSPPLYLKPGNNYFNFDILFRSGCSFYIMGTDASNQYGVELFRVSRTGFSSNFVATTFPAGLDYDAWYNMVVVVTPSLTTLNIYKKSDGSLVGTYTVNPGLLSPDHTVTQLRVDGMRRVKEYNQLYLDNLQVGYPNTAPVATFTSPPSVTPYGGSMNVNYSVSDAQGDPVPVHALKIGTTAGGSDLYSGAPNVSASNTGGAHVQNLSSLPLVWNPGNNRYEKTVYIQAYVEDDQGLGATYSTSTLIYNYSPSFGLSTAASTVSVNDDAFTLRGKVSDPTGDGVKVWADIGGMHREVTVNPTPYSMPGTDNVILSFSGLPEGTYTGIKVYYQDVYGYPSTPASVTWNGTLKVKNVLKSINEDVTAMAFKTQDYLGAVGISNLNVTQNAGNDSAAAGIKSKLLNRNASMLFIGNSGSTEAYLKSVLSTEYAAYTSGFTNTLIQHVINKDALLVSQNASDFIPGETVGYNMLFSDFENDYPGLSAAEKVSGAFSAAAQVPKANTLKYTLLHNPSVFESPAALHNKNQPAASTIQNMQSSGLIQAVDASMRGLWTMTLKGQDSTGNDPFDVYSPDKILQFYIHYPPVARGYLNDTGTHYTLSGANSYDPDYASTADRGIKSWTWKARTTDGIWHDNGVGKYQTMPYTIGGMAINAYSLTVTDNFGRPTTALYDLNPNLKAMLSVDKPKPYALKELESFTATMKVTTVEAITSVTAWVENWPGAPASMTFVGKVGDESTYRCTFAVPAKTVIKDGDYMVLSHVTTAVGSEATRYAEINVLNNRPPDHDSVVVTPSPAYSGDTVGATIRFHDPDGDVLSHHVTLTRGGTVVFDQTRVVTSAGMNYPQQVLAMLASAPAGSYTLTSVITDPYGASDTYTVNFDVRLFIISGTMLPADPMAGDELIFNIHSEGGIDRFQLLLDSDVTDNDQRVAMGYPAASYPVSWSVNGSDSIKESELRYILWCTTPQSLTLKGVRNRAAYTFVIRAYIGSVYRDLTFVREVSGDVRQLIKTK